MRFLRFERYLPDDKSLSAHFFEVVEGQSVDGQLVDETEPTVRVDLDSHLIRSHVETSRSDQSKHPVFTKHFLASQIRRLINKLLVNLNE